MSVARDSIVKALTPTIPQVILTQMLDQYLHIKQQFFLNKFQPSELNAARFGECVLRLVEHLDKGVYTPFNTQLNTEKIIKDAANNTNIPNTFQLFLPRLVRVILDVRNKRDVAHVGGEVSPNYSDSIFVVHCADWILTEIVRHFYNCGIDEARKIVASINETSIPVVAEINGFLRVQNTSLDARKKTLVVLYYKEQTDVSETDICKWIRYGNISRFKSDILKKLDDEALIHYQAGFCRLLPKGVMYVEKNIPLDLLV